MRVISTIVLLFLSNLGFSQFSYQEVEMGCMNFTKIQESQVIDNQQDYDKLYEILSPHPSCDTYQLPSIDFSKYLLIGVVASTAGCDKPDYQIETFENNNRCTVKFNITVRGMCKMSNTISKWLLVEKKNCDEMSVTMNYN